MCERWTIAVAKKAENLEPLESIINSFFDFEGPLLGITVKPKGTNYVVFQKGRRECTQKGALKRPWWIAGLSRDLRAAGLKPQIKKVTI